MLLFTQFSDDIWEMHGGELHAPYADPSPGSGYVVHIAENGRSTCHHGVTLTDKRWTRAPNDLPHGFRLCCFCTWRLERRGFDTRTIGYQDRPRCPQCAVHDGDRQWIRQRCPICKARLEEQDEWRARRSMTMSAHERWGLSYGEYYSGEGMSA